MNARHSRYITLVTRTHARWCAVRVSFHVRIGVLGGGRVQCRETHDRTPFTLYSGSGVLEAFNAGHMQCTSFVLHNARDAHAHAAVSHAAALLSAVHLKLTKHQRTSFALYNGSGVLDALDAHRNNTTHVTRVI